MAITQNSLRQYVLSANVNIGFADFAGANGEPVSTVETFDAIDFPANSVVVSGHLATVTDFADDDDDTYTADVGILLPLDRDEYVSGVSIDGDEGTVDQFIAVLGILQTAAHVMTFTLLSAAADDVLTAGELRLVADYITVGRGNDQIG